MQDSFRKFQFEHHEREGDGNGNGDGNKGFPDPPELREREPLQPRSTARGSQQKKVGAQTVYEPAEKLSDPPVPTATTTPLDPFTGLGVRTAGRPDSLIVFRRSEFDAWQAGDLTQVQGRSSTYANANAVANACAVDGTGMEVENHPGFMREMDDHTGRNGNVLQTQTQTQSHSQSRGRMERPEPQPRTYYRKVGQVVNGNNDYHNVYNYNHNYNGTHYHGKYIREVHHHVHHHHHTNANAKDPADRTGRGFVGSKAGRHAGETEAGYVDGDSSGDGAYADRKTMPMSDSPSEETEQVGKKELELDTAMELGDSLEAEESVLSQLDDDVDDEVRAVRFNVPEKEEDGDGDLVGAHDDSCAGPLANEINKGSEVSMNPTKSDQQMEPQARPYEGLNRGQLLGRLLEAVRRCEVLEVENSNLHAYQALREKAVSGAGDAKGQAMTSSSSGRAVQRMQQKDRARFELVAQQEVINMDLQAENVRLREQLQLQDLIGGRGKD